MRFAVLLLAALHANAEDVYSCVAGGYSGEPLFQIETDSLGACKEHCSKVPDCRHIEFDSGKCNVFSTTAEPKDVSADTEATRCTKAEEYPCTLHRDSPAAEILLLESVSANDPSCFEACTGMRLCASVVFDITENTCSLRKADKGSTVESTSHVVCTKPVKKQQEACAFACVSSKRFSSDPLFTIEMVADVSECQAHCKGTTGCSGVAYNSKKECTLHQGGQMETLEDASSMCCTKEDVVKPVQPTKPAPTTMAPMTKKRDYHCQKGAFDGTELFVVEMTSSVEACEAHCTGIDGCVGLTHTGEACTLYGRNAVLDTNKEGTSCMVLKDLLFDCAEGKRFAGALFEIGDVQSLAECKRQCSAFSSVCHGINYGADKGCELVSSVETFASEFEKGTESCAVVTDSLPRKEKKSRFVCATGSAKGADLVTFENVNSVDECTEFCLSLGPCSTFVFTEDQGNCVLKASPSSLVLGGTGLACQKERKMVKLDESRTANYSCKNTTATGAPLRVVPRSSEAECRLLCAASPACEFFVLSQRGMCILETSGSQAAARSTVSGKVCTKTVKVDPRHVSGFGVLPSKAAAAGTIEPVDGFRCVRASYESGSIKTVDNVPTHTECSNACRTVTHCDIAVHHPADRRCVLKSLHAMRTEGAEHAVACVKDTITAFPTFHCTETSSFLEGTLGVLNDVTLASCRTQCDKMDDCRVAQYTHETRGCDLKSFEAFQEGPRVGVTACARLVREHRTLRALSAQETNLRAHSSMTMGLHVTRLSQVVWEDKDEVPSNDNAGVLWSWTNVKVPSGMDPVVFDALLAATMEKELQSEDNLFMNALNPTLGYLGLDSISAGANGKWSMGGDGHKWLTLLNEVFLFPLYINVPDGIDFNRALDRRWVSRYVSTLTRLMASTISFSSYEQCDDSKTVCTASWEAATPDTIGVSRASDALSDGSIRELVLAVEVPLGEDKATFCQFMRTSLECDSLAGTGIANTFGVFECGECGGINNNSTDNETDSAPVDAPIDTEGDDVTSVATSRRLLQINNNNQGWQCTTGWKPAYGLLSSVFDTTNNTVINGTFAECNATCVEGDDGCVAFTRRTDIDDDDVSECTFKRAILPGAGDQIAYDSLGTYITQCPEELHDETRCNWRYVYQRDLRNESSINAFNGTTANSTDINGTDTGVTSAVSFAACKDMCQEVADCTGVSYDTEHGLCYFLQTDITSEEMSNRDRAFKSAICYRNASSTCSNSPCGEDSSITCYPLTDEVVCGCQHGFRCTANCNDANPVCVRRASMQEMFLEAVTDTVGVDRAGLIVTKVEVTDPGTVDPPSPPSPPTPTDTASPEEEEVLEVKQLPVDIPTTFVLSVTLDNMDVDQLLEVSGSASKVQNMMNAFSTRLSVSPSLLSIMHICQVTSTDTEVLCKDANSNSITVPATPTIKVTPSANFSSGATWCSAFTTPSQNPEFEDQAVIEAFVIRSKGELMESRSYWVGATCDTDCSTAAQWKWVSGTGVDWGALAVNDTHLTDATKCAVLQWDSQLFRWGLAAVSCDNSDHYPICDTIGTVAEDPAECTTSGACDVRTTFSVQLEMKRNVDFIQFADGSIRQYHPSDLLPVGMKIVRDGSVLGYVDTEGKTTAISYPPKDTLDYAAITEVAVEGNYPSEMVRTFFFTYMDAELTTANIATGHVSVCHEYYYHLHVKCEYTSLSCSLVNPLFILHTSCDGNPPCLNSVCSGHGYVRGFEGHCQCTCDTGFTAQDCGACDTGFSDYPECLPDITPNETNTTNPLYVVMQFRFSQSHTYIEDNMAVFGTVIREVYGSLVSSFYLSYVCQGSACDDGYCSIEKPVLEWSTTRSAKCVAYGTTLSAENQHQVMSRSADALAAGDVGDNNVGAFVEMYFTADKDISNTAEECSAILDARMLLAHTRGDLAPFSLDLYYTVYGPATDPYSTDIYNQSQNAAEAQSLADEDDSKTAIIIMSVVFASCCLCMSLLIAIWKYREQQADQEKETTEELLKQLDADSDYEEYEDFLTIYKEAHEPMGIMWDDHTLLVGVCDNTAAADHGAERFRNRRVIRVNGTKVTRLHEIREIVEGEPVVTLEFEPRSASICICLAEALVDFDEDSFLYTFAERVSYSLDLMDFSDMDMEMQSSEEVNGELQLVIKFFGLTGEQVAAIVDMCITPGNDIKNGLPIIGAYLNGAGKKTVPKLWVSCQWLSEAAECSGVYLPMPNTLQNGLPVWQHAPSDHWMYATASGFWTIVSDRTLIGSDVTTSYVLRSSIQHRGALPHVINKWRTPLREDPHTVVSLKEPRAHEFVVGQKVVFPQDVQLEGDGCFISKDSMGLVMCALESNMVQVCLLNEEYDVVTISAESLDSPDGPRVSVLHEERWMDATIVKEARDEVGDEIVKVRFDCSLCPPMWVDKDKLRIKLPDVFTIGDTVRVSGDEGLGALEKGETGEVIACSDGGQARPYLVSGPYASHWYAPHQIEKVTTLQAMDRTRSLPFGDDDVAGEYSATHVESMSSAPYGMQEEVSHIPSMNIMHDRKRNPEKED